MPKQHRMIFRCPQYRWEPDKDAYCAQPGNWFTNLLQRIAVRILNRFGKHPDIPELEYKEIVISQDSIIALLRRQRNLVGRLQCKATYKVLCSPETFGELLDEAKSYPWRIYVTQEMIVDNQIKVLGMTIICCPWYLGEPVILPVEVFR